MFKKKSPNNYSIAQRQSIQNQKIYGIEAKLESMIQNGNRSMLMREKQNKSRVHVQSEISSQVLSQKSTSNPQQVPYKNRSSHLNVSNNNQVLKNGDEKNVKSFESQLKGLIKIIYQKEKEIQKLKINIKEASQISQSTSCKRCSSQQISSSFETQELGLNVDEIKETTQKIIELEAKQEELHEVIDFLVKKEEDSAKSIKELTARNKELVNGNEILSKQLDQKEKLIRKHEQQIGRFKDQLKHQDQEILRLNTDIVNAISQAKQTEHELNQKIESISKEKNNFESQLQKAIERAKRQFEQEKQSLDYEIQNLRTIEEETKIVMREQEVAIEKLEIKIEQEQLLRQNLTKQYNAYIQQKDEQMAQLIQQINQIQSQSSCPSQNSNTLQKDYKQQVKQNTINKSTIEEYKKLLDKLKTDLNNQEKLHEKEIQNYERKITDLEIQVFEVKSQLEREKSQGEEQIKKLNKIIQEIRHKSGKELERKEKEILKIRENYEGQITDMQNVHIHAQQTLDQYLNQVKEELTNSQNQALSLESNNDLLRQQLLIVQQKCLQLEHQITVHKQKLLTLQQSSPQMHTDHLISLPTIQNISCIDLANSSFECKLQQLVHFDTKHNIQEEDSHSIAQNHQLAPLEQNSLEQNSSYIRYQDNLIQELERQCNQPTELFLNQDNNRTKLVELSEARQSLKMTKEVNFQLFEEINRQEKIITQFKNTLRSFIQSQKQSTSTSFKNTPNQFQFSLQKLENLLLLK